MSGKLFTFLTLLSTSSLALASDVNLYNIPYSNRADIPYVRITNTADQAATIRGTYFTQEGEVLGQADSLFIDGLEPNQTFIINASRIEELVGADDLPESGRGRLSITSSQDDVVVMSLIRTSEQILTNTSEVSNDGLLLSVPSSASSDEFYIRVTNTKDEPIQVTGQVTLDDASVLAPADTVLFENVQPGQTAVLSKWALEEKISSSHWEGYAKLTLEPSEDIVIMGMNRSSNVLVNTSATNDSEWIDYIPADTTGEVFTLRILNADNAAMAISARLYAENGSQIASGRLAQSLAAGEVLTLNADSLMTALQMNHSWEGIAKLKLESSSSRFKWHNLIRAGGTLTNLSSQSETLSVHNIPASNNYADTSLLRVSNHTNQTIALTGTLYHQDGQIIGQASANFGELTPFATHNLSALDIEDILGVGPWTGRARLVFDQVTEGVVGIHGIVKKEGVVTNLSQPVQMLRETTFSLTSTSFENDDNIPTRYACTFEPSGRNVSPQLSWNTIPEGTQNFAVIMDDPTADNWIHWNLWNIPASVGSVEENTAEGTKGRNDLPGTGYFGPCPPARHQYVFTVYALSEPFSSSRALTREDFERNHSDIIISSASMNAWYSPQ